jgi:small-conductance mechanosensitive channel/nucleotide-binding universal stress UspA family protein
LVSFDWLEDQVLGSEIVVQDVLIAGAIFLLGIILASFMPRMMANNIARIFSNIEFRSFIKGGKKKKEEEKQERKQKIDKRMKRTVAKPVKRGLIGFYLLLFLVLAVYSLPIEMGTTFEVYGEDYQAWRFLQFGVAFVLILLLSIFALEPILKASIYALLGRGVTNRQKYRLYRSLKVAVKLFIIVFGTFASMKLSFTNAQIDLVGWLIDIMVFTMLMLAAYIIAQIVVTLTEPQFQSGEKSKNDMGKAIGRAIRIGIYLFGIILGMLYIGVRPEAIFGGSVVAGIILGFGLQDSIANLAAGVQIVMDKPFVIGDRIRLDWGGRETWGDVTDISLRSTWIKTPEDEMIVIPNSVIGSSQVWNYTRESPRVALHFDVGISYDSDWKLAEKLLLEILHKHPLVLTKPPPYILMKDFVESAQILTVWFWIPEARDRLAIQSDILKRIKDAFDHNGVEIPYPYRTQVYKADMPKPHRLADEYKSPVYLPSTGFKKFKVQQDTMVEVETTSTVILAPTSGAFAARNTAPFVMETAKKMSASVTALYIRTPGTTSLDGQEALRIYNEVAKAYSVEIKVLYKEGDIIGNILDSVESESASLVIMGTNEETMFGRITRRSISQELLRHTSVPTMIIPMKALMKMKARKEMEKKEAERRFDEDRVDFTSLSALERMEEEGMDFDEE